jgi:hypothetical protein
MAARKAKDGPYVQMTAEEAMDGFQALGCHAALVWYELLYLAWKTKSRTVLLPNRGLAKMGVSKWTKRPALSRLKLARLIRVTQDVGKSPRITLLRR